MGRLFEIELALKLLYTAEREGKRLERPMLVRIKTEEKRQMMRIGTWVIVLLCCFASNIDAQDGGVSVGVESDFDSQVSIARALPSDQRSAALRKISAAQASRQEPVAALKTLSYISDPHELATGLAEMRLIAGGGSESNGNLETNFKSPANGGAGGASLADFTSLIDLIQTTVSPDTWEALGGPSTMREYVAGIYVDGEGVVQDVVASENGTILDNIEVMLDADGARLAEQKRSVDAWRLATDYRCVSLLKLSKEIVRRRLSGEPVDEAIRNMAGLSRVQYIVLDSDNSDVILVGPVGGIERLAGWLRDRKTGRVTMRVEYFVAAASSIWMGQPFGCTIDPTEAALAAAAQAADEFQRRETPIGLAPDAIRKALGNQDVRVFGTAGDTPLGYLMVEADRHMKQLALGLQPMPEGTPNYLDMITRHIAQGPPHGQLLRLWFTGSPMAVRVDNAGLVYELAGCPLKLDSETRLAAQDGGRIPAPADFRVTEFVQQFNDHFSDIASLHPIYGALESVYRSAAIAEVLRRSTASAWLPGILGPMLLDDPSLGQLQTPRKVASIATLHRVTHRGKRHAIVVASGGVLIDTRETVETNFRPYDSIGSLQDRFFAPGDTKSEEPGDNTKPLWWWNAD